MRNIIPLKNDSKDEKGILSENRYKDEYNKSENVEKKNSCTSTQVAKIKQCNRNASGKRHERHFMIAVSIVLHAGPIQSILKNSLLVYKSLIE